MTLLPLSCVLTAWVLYIVVKDSSIVLSLSLKWYKDYKCFMLFFIYVGFISTVI